MAGTHPRQFAIGLLLTQFAGAMASAERVATCDFESGACSIEGDDAMSVMQLRGGVEDELAEELSEDQQEGLQEELSEEPTEESMGEGYGKYWKLINAYSVADELKYSKSDDENPMPECLQGLMYMDQQCLTYPEMPEEERATPCLGRAPPHMWVNEYVTSFGDWDPKTRCFLAERVGWTFGDAASSESVCAGIGIQACQVNADTHPDPCQVGAKFGSTNMGPFKWYLLKTETAWSRITPYFFPMTTKYPVHQVVDGHGKKTKWFQNYITEAMQKHCKSDAKQYGGSKGCRKSEWAAEGKIAMCTGSSP